MDSAADLAAAFGAFDRARLGRMDADALRAQLAARELLGEYVEALWQDVQRSGEKPEEGDKYRSIAAMVELTRALRMVAFDAVYDPLP